VGYRAPGFSIDNRTPWAYLELADQGYAYSSSIAPISHRYFGWGEAPRFAFKPLPWTDLVEIPITTAEFGGKRMAAGGGLFRALPYGLSRWAIRQVNRREYRPAIFFFHLWELDPELGQAQGMLASSNPRQSARFDTMAQRLRQLVDEFTWGRIDVVAHREASKLRDLAA
ncbi:MAG TPA: DUF3473 domain-containing protein, partial [Sphingomonadaceae bacterium]|nr:DUF3473 domain-containing protein [Sphingomonadaceae bacterium]